MTYFYFPRECDNYYTKNSFTRFSAKCRVAVNGSQLCYSQNSSKFHASENSFKNFGGLKRLGPHGKKLNQVWELVEGVFIFRLNLQMKLNLFIWFLVTCGTVAFVFTLFNNINLKKNCHLILENETDLILSFLSNYF